MGYGGKVVEQQRARELRAQSLTLQEIADELGVSKSSVSLWVRGVDFEARPRNRGHRRHRPHPMSVREQVDINQSQSFAAAWLETVEGDASTPFALALYAGDGSKADGPIVFANSNPDLVAVFLRWLRATFPLEESRVRMRLYLHDDLDVERAIAFWSSRLAVDPTQFNAPIRPVARPTRRTNRHEFGCAAVVYNSRSIHRRVMAMIEAITCQFVNPG